MPESPRHAASSARTAPASSTSADARSPHAVLTFASDVTVHVSGPYPDADSAATAGERIMHHQPGAITWSVKLMAPGADLASTLHDNPHQPDVRWWLADCITHLYLNRNRTQAINHTPQPPDQARAAIVLVITPDGSNAVLIGSFPTMREARAWTWRRARRSDELGLTANLTHKILPLDPPTGGPRPLETDPPSPVPDTAVTPPPADPGTERRRVRIAWGERITYQQDIDVEVPDGYTGDLRHLITTDDDPLQDDEVPGVPAGYRSRWLERIDTSDIFALEDRSIHEVTDLTTPRQPSAPTTPPALR